MRNRDICKDKQTRKCKNNMKRKEKMIPENGSEEKMRKEYMGIEIERKQKSNVAENRVR